ncbi:hypothetical protein F0562_005441 [Nyssa sinensis]|uniref:W2 domain-containing protein n=1 Tax=Nyssa sinensis TaxID=561372 RepID=A0A5J5AHS9_9ASTE|nr:hypothetical protein F0562_005441 [Nyssa sinensis]
MSRRRSQRQANRASDNLKSASLPLEENPQIANGSSTYERLVKEMKANLKKGVAANQFQSILGSISGSAQEIMTALFEALFDGVEKGFVKALANKKGYLAAAVAHGEGSQLLLLQAIEAFFLKARAVALKEVALVLKALYDADLLEEEHIVQCSYVLPTAQRGVWKQFFPK